MIITQAPGLHLRASRRLGLDLALRGGAYA